MVSLAKYNTKTKIKREKGVLLVQSELCTRSIPVSRLEIDRVADMQNAAIFAALIDAHRL